MSQGHSAAEAMKDLLFGGSTAFRDKYDPGHIIAATLGGPHATENLVPLIREFNRSGAWSSFEDRVRRCLNDPSVTSGTIYAELKYDNTGEAMYVPTSITIAVSFTSPGNMPNGPVLTFRNRSGNARNFAGKPCFHDWE